jgi:hypothetical protein
MTGMPTKGKNGPKATKAQLINPMISGVLFGTGGEEGSDDMNRAESYLFKLSIA